MAIVICVVMIPVAAIAVDIGMQRVVRRDMQSLADVMALDMSRQITGKKLSEYTPAQKAALQSALEASRDRNVTNLGYGSAGKTADVTYTLGTVDQSRYGQSDYFTAATLPATIPTAIKVTAKATVDFGLAAALPNGGFTKGSAERSAIGTAGKYGCMQMDSYAAALKSGDSTVLGPLLKILDSNIDTQVLSSSGILTTDLDVLKFMGILQANLGVGGFDDVLTTNVTAAQVIAAQVAALNSQGATAAAQALQSQIGLHVPPGQFKVQDLLGVAAGGAAGLATSINAFDLAAAAVQLANGTKPVSLNVSGAGLTGLSATATIGSKPTVVCYGRGKVQHEQTTATATANILQNGTILAGVNTIVSGLTGLVSNILCNTLGVLFSGTCYGVPSISGLTISATAGLARASGTVTDVTCADKSYLSVLEQSELAPLTATASITFTAKRTVYKFGAVTAVDYPTSTVTIQLDTTASDALSRSAKLYFPDDYDTPKAGPSGDLSIGHLTPQVIASGDLLLINKLGGLVGTVTDNLLTPVVRDIATPLLNNVTSALQSMVGLTIAGSTYEPLRTPSCGQPKLIG